MNVKDLKIRSEILDTRYEPAVDLGDVVKGKAPSFILDPVAFFGRTYFTSSMKKLIIKVLMNLLGIKSVELGGRRYDVASNLILLPSDLGGGKTHSLILLFQIFKLISESENANDVVSKVSILDKDLAEFIQKYWGDLKKINPKIVVIDCKYSDLAPGPVKPIEIGGRKIKTLWGYLGYELGRYEFIKEFDEREVAPYADVLSGILNESRAVILIDEIGRYYDMSGLEPTKISTFLMNLAEVMSKYTIREVAIIISVPYEYKEYKGTIEAKASMKYVHSPELIEAINRVLSRPNVEIIKPVERQDLVEILRKRIFDHNEEEFKKFADAFISSELTKSYPEQVREVLDNRGFWKEIRRKYPFHPIFLEVLEKLAYKLPHLQKTRDAIKIAVQTVLTIREGLFDWLEDGVSLVMPYHIPVFVSEVLDSTILRNASREYKVFQLILRSNVAESFPMITLKNMESKEFYERVLARFLRELDLEDAKASFKLATVIWLHSLVGLGLPMNMSDYPTTTDLMYSVSPTEADVKGLLGILRSILPQLIVHGDPDSDTSRWFFTSIPSIEELIEILKKNVTDNMAKEKLRSLLEGGISGKGKKGKKRIKGTRKSNIFDSRVKVSEDIQSIDQEFIDANNPVLIVFSDAVSSDDLLSLMKGRNHLVVLAPYVRGLDEPEKLAPEDIRGIRELTTLKDGVVWDGLLEILRYYVAADHIGEDHIRSFVGEKIAGDENNQLLAEDLIKLLKAKVDSKKEYFYRHSWNLINRCYQKVYYHRLGKIMIERGLSLESDSSIAVIVEEFLKEKGLIPFTFGKEDLLSIYKNYLKKDPEEDPINVGNLWHFIRTTDKANVPLITYKMFLEAVKELIKSLDYGVKIGSLLLWKPIFNNKTEAKEKDEGEELLKKVNEYIKTGKSWDEIELIYWKKIFNDWINNIINNVPQDKMLRILDKQGRVMDIRDVLEGFSPESVIRTGKLFYEKRKYIVDVSIDLPRELLENEEVEGKIKINVENFADELLVELQPDKGLEIDKKSFRGTPPLEISLKLKALRAGNYYIKLKISTSKEVIDERNFEVRVKGSEIIEDVSGQDVFIDEPIKVIAVETKEALGIQDIQRLASLFGGKIHFNVAFQSNEHTLKVDLETNDIQLLGLLWGALSNIFGRFREAKPQIFVKLLFEKEVNLEDIKNMLVSPELLTFKIKRHVGK